MTPRWKIRRESSPRAWGCFQGKWKQIALVEVFPTCVGVFPYMEFVMFCAIGLPHVRGGVSVSPMKPVAVRVSSPRAWGCF